MYESRLQRVASGFCFIKLFPKFTKKKKKKTSCELGKKVIQ